jgi:hypothetical protein
LFVIPAQAGIQSTKALAPSANKTPMHIEQMRWIPACAGMTA